MTKGNLRVVTMSPVPVSVSVIPVNIDPGHRTAATITVSGDTSPTSALELQTKVREDYVITEKAPTRAYWL